MKQQPKILRHYAFVSIILLTIACNDKKNNSLVSSDLSSDALDISYKVPGDLRADASQIELALFAWQEFFALNWQSSHASDNRRTTPDTTWDFTSQSQPDLAVWETYIHRTELRPANGMRTRDLSTGLPNYTFIDSTRINVGPNAIDLSSYWNVLDEDNEIGSAYVFAHKNEYEVLYAAKTNLVEYDYAKNNFPTDSELDAASHKGKNQGLSYFTGLSKAEMCASVTNTENGLICLPCGDQTGNEGAIEVKLAFRKLDASKGDDASRFIIKEVVTFKDDPYSSNIVANVDTFGLIGMHIIHKTENYPAFIFASWEQVDERNNDIQTIGIDTVTVNDSSYGDVDPHRLNPVIERVIPETVQVVNDFVHDEITSANSTSKWQHYQLIGVQATPIDYTDRTTKDNNYFMANYVIESDLKLTNFHGSFGDPFNTSVQNVAYDYKSFNMGGCQGCHGQAQLKFGTDFSFLLDSGAGKPVPEPDVYQTYQEALQSANPNSPTNSKLSSKKRNKLQAYIRQMD